MEKPQIPLWSHGASLWVYKGIGHKDYFDAQHKYTVDLAIYADNTVVFSNEELMTMCELLMVCDPWPAADKSRGIFEKMCDKVSVSHGYTDWIEAYHGG